MTVTPPHPEHECSQTLAIYAKVVGRIARLRSAGFPIHEHLEAASELLDELAEHTIGTAPERGKPDHQIHLDQSILEHVLAGTLAAAPGVPGGQALDGDGTHGHRTIVDEFGDPIPHRPDPTGDAALQDDLGAATRHDLRRALDDIVRHLTHYLEDPRTHAQVIRAQADRVRKVCSGWLPRHPTRKDQIEAPTEGDPGCAIHAELVDGGTWWYRPVAHEWQPPLGPKIGLCDWCYDIAVDSIPPCPPTPAEVKRHQPRNQRPPRVYRQRRKVS